MSAVATPLDHRRSPRVSPPHELRVVNGPVLLAHLDDGPSLGAHRERYGPPPTLRLEAVVAAASAMDIRGRGGAGFPFAVKLATAARSRRRVVVVNLAEGEPASAKDSALAIFAPHRILDGAATVAGALRTREVHVVVPGDRPVVRDAVTEAVTERREAGERLRWTLHRARPAFVAGQARAVLELMAGRENLPVTAWTPEAVRGHHGRPTLLSNGETWAQVWALLNGGPERYARHGTTDEPGTTLLSIGGDHQDPVVVEVGYGSSWSGVLTAEQMAQPVLLGGYHGTWAARGELADAVVSRPGLAALGLTLGAGVVLPLPLGGCPLTRTSEIVRYLAGQSARRCGPCLNGLPALAEALTCVAAPSGAPGVPDDGLSARGRVEDLVGLIDGRGACAHPDGTARLVRSLFRAVPDEARRHASGSCGFAPEPHGEEVSG